MFGGGGGEGHNVDKSLLNVSNSRFSHSLRIGYCMDCVDLINHSVGCMLFHQLRPPQTFLCTVFSHSDLALIKPYIFLRFQARRILRKTPTQIPRKTLPKSQRKTCGCSTSIRTHKSVPTYWRRSEIRLS